MGTADNNELSFGWILFAGFAVASVAIGFSLLVLLDKLPEQYVSGPGGAETEVLGINFFRHAYWYSTNVCLLFYNIFSSMIQKKLSIWQWKLVSNGGRLDDFKSWSVMATSEMLQTTLGFATLFFSVINVYFLLSSAVGKTVGVMLVAYLNGKERFRRYERIKTNQ
jgi:hypothetical protein